ncbi:serine threonine- kinase pim-2-like, partial [Paramuricea clavata]
DKDLGPVPGEVYFLKQMKYHPNVIKFLHYQQLTSEMFVIICERIANCKDLFDVRKERGGFFTEYETQKYVKTLVDVVRAMEKKNIIHRDIKLENILYDVEKDDIKLIDFGLATKHKPGKLFTTFW